MMLSVLDDLEQQVDAGLVVDARVEPDVAHDQLVELGATQVEVHAAVAAPVVRDRATAVGNDESQGRKVFEELRLLDELHERRRVGIQVVRAGLVERGITGGADVDHCWHVQLDHLFVQRVPVAVGQWRFLPVTAGRVWAQVAADKAELVDAPFQFWDAVLGSARLGIAAVGRRR